MVQISGSNKFIDIAIDASRNRSGGAKSHLIGLLGNADPRDYGIRKVHIWAYKALLEMLPEPSWLVKHSPVALEQSLLHQVFWQVFSFPDEVVKNGCDIVLNTDAGTLSCAKPAVTISRDMLSYEPGEIERYGWTKARLRLVILRIIQNWSLRRSDGAIFLTRYAAEVIQRSSGPVRRIGLIPHGVGQIFKELEHNLPWPTQGERAIRLLYISNAALYKHQWIVVQAVERLRKQGLDVSLLLVGGGSGPAQKRLQAQITVSDPLGEFVTQEQFVSQSELPAYLLNADIFIFASSCENMPNTLVEAMAAGLPIACSRRGPMPEVLEDAGEYFDPDIPETLDAAICKLIDDAELRGRLALRAKTLAERYSWERCARETWSFLVETHQLAHSSRK